MPVDDNEPEHVALAVSALGLKHAVITSVTRDDLPDGGAEHFFRVVAAIKKETPNTTIEVLIPDFKGNNEALKTVINAAPDIINHNVETVPRLYLEVRPKADYQRSLNLLREVKATGNSLFTKSGIMLGLGETTAEVIGVFKDLRKADCDFLTIGQYLAPSSYHHPVVEYVHPDMFNMLKEKAYEMGFLHVASGPFVRSSYMAEEALSQSKIRNSKQLNELEHISRNAGSRPDYVQGGGGNTSVKLNENLMAIKASGYRLKDISRTEGFAVVNYKNIKEYHEKIDITMCCNFEKESSKLIQENIVPVGGLKQLRPSVETGFHSILQKYVIHTHSVYANIICCSQGGNSLAGEIFKDKGYGVIWIPYINPGFSLMLAIEEEIARHAECHAHFPNVIFMENHGLVISADTASRSIELHEEVNETIRNYFNITENYPFAGIEKVNKGNYISKSEHLRNYFKGRDVTPDFFDNIILYPDQLVYLNGNISVNSTNSKLNINTETGEILYKTNEIEALTMEEILMAFVYIMENIHRNSLQLKAINSTGAGFTPNLESGKYRKSILYDKK